LNEAMPRWRTFSSAPPAVVDGEEAAASDDGTEKTARRRSPDLPALAAAAVGGAAIGTAALVVAVLVSGSLASGGLAASLGEPLDGTGLGVSGATAERGWDGPSAAIGAGDVGAEIVVDIAGAVARPGLVRMRDGDRIGDAIEAAGGFGPRVDLAAAGVSLNLAQPLSDGLKVVVPELGAHGAPAADGGDGRIDLNAADQAALESLPGIGPVTAGEIIAARSQQPFRSVEELRSRGIVGESVYADIEALVRASG
jgi:competence protein ComEA